MKMRIKETIPSVHLYKLFFNFIHSSDYWVCLKPFESNEGIHQGAICKVRFHKSPSSPVKAEVHRSELDAQMNRREEKAKQNGHGNVLGQNGGYYFK